MVRHLDNVMWQIRKYREIGDGETVRTAVVRGSSIYAATD